MKLQDFKTSFKVRDDLNMFDFFHYRHLAPPLFWQKYEFYLLAQKNSHLYMYKNIVVVYMVKFQQRWCSNWINSLLPKVETIAPKRIESESKKNQFHNSGRYSSVFACWHLRSLTTSKFIGVGPKFACLIFFPKSGSIYVTAVVKWVKPTPFFQKFKIADINMGKREVVLVLFYRSSRRGANVEQ